MKYFLVPFLFFMSCFVFGQTSEIDSLTVMNLLKEGSNESDTIIQLQKFRKALILSKGFKFNYGIYASHNKIGNWKKIKYNSDSSIVQYKRGIKDLPLNSDYKSNFNDLIGNEFKSTSQYDSALYYFKKSMKLGEKIHKKSIVVKGYMNIGNMWFQNFEHDKAFKNYALADSICETEPNLKSSALRAQINNFLGYSVRVTHGYEKAIEYYNVSKQLYEKVKNEAGVQELNIAIAQAKISLNKYDEALKLLNESIDYHEKEAPTKNSYSYGIIVRGFLLIKMNKFKEAEKDYKLYYDLAVKSKNKTYQRWGLAYLGDFYRDIKKYNIAIEYYKKAIKECKEVGDFGKELETTESLIEVYKMNNDLNSAVETYEEYIELQQKIDKKKITEKTFDIETKYQTEKKEQEITLLKTQNELTEQQKKSQRNLMLAGLGITTIAGLFLFVLYRNRQKTNAKLRELDTAKSNFFANISHEFRTPLTLISNPIDEALEDPGITDTKREKFVMAKRNSDRLLSLVNQLLDLSKIDAGQLKLHIQKSNPLQLIAALGESFNYAAKQNSINYKVDIKDTGKEAWFDKDALDKITINLLSNAIKYTPNNGSVVCNASIEDEKLFLEVKNSGGGLTKAQLSNVFQRFYQTSEENQGTGIGLALVKELVDLHKGTIKVDSIPNEFTTFTVALPVSKNSFKNEQFMDSQKIEYAIETNLENQVTQEDEEFTDNDQPILLIVEDNEDVRTLLKQTFETSYNILTASNGDIGVALALEHIPDIIISDIMMPIKDGIALTNALKNDERTSHIPIILLTAKAGEENELKGIEIGADDYITKPFSSKILITKVSKLIEIRQKLQSRYSQEVVLMPKDIAITSLDEQFLEKVQTVLDNKLVEASFSIEDFSKAVGMSRMQLHRKIKALTGLSASEFIRSQRLKLAAQLLKKSDINISQVGYTVGFNDHSYFTKCFKEAYNCTPTEYSKQHS